MLSESEVRLHVVELFKRSGLTQAEAAAKADIQPSTLSRYLAGDSKSPYFMNLCSLIIALGGSVDEIIGNVSEEDQGEPQKEIIIRTDEKYVGKLVEDLSYERKMKQIIIVALAVVVVSFIGFLIFDLLHPEIGFIQYGDAVKYFMEEDNLSKMLGYII